MAQRLPFPRLAFYLALLCLLVPVSAAAQQCPSQVWADEFNGSTLDTSKWSYQTGDGCDIGICGWGNNELQSYQEANVAVGNGTLTITARKERIRNINYTSGRIRSINKGDFTFGRMEARIKIPQGQGLWPAFWMLPTDEIYGGWPQSGEIDIMENVGYEPKTVHGTIHYGDPYPDNQSTGTAYKLTADEPIFADEYHEFAIEREPGEIRWYVDDVLYARKTTSDIEPYDWPFDERFHFLLNVAVGGNWPGDPDETTVFPQTMDVDYVRVYDGYFPYITGERVVNYEAAGETYTVGNVPSGTSVSWSVPPGATVVSGQGTPTATVDWGSTGGDVVATFNDGCSDEQMPITVEVEPPFVQDFSFENFDSAGNATLSSTTGTLTETTNPDLSGVNTSATSGEYVRNGTEQYDLIVYNTAAVPDASAYTSKSRKFYVDVYSTAPIGTDVLLQLEDSGSATSSNYPTGRHSRYSAVTTTQNQWERLEFTLLDEPDAGTADDGVDTMILMFAPNTQTSDTYYFDNLDSYKVDTGGDTGTAPSAPTDLTASAVSSSQIDLAWTDNATDESGFRIERSTDGTTFSEVAVLNTDVTQYSDTDLVASTTYTYRVQAYNASGASSFTSTVSTTTESGTSSSAMHVGAIVLGEQKAGQGRSKGTADVTVVDGNGDPVPDATVYGTFSGTFTGSTSAVTDASGVAVLVSSSSAKGKLNFTLCVDDVTHAALSYDPSANTVTCSDGASKRAAMNDEERKFALDPNYPNPVRATTTIDYSLPESQHVKLVVYNILGEKVAVLVDGPRGSGEHTVSFQTQNLPSGAYIYRLTAGGRQESHMLTVVK